MDAEQRYRILQIKPGKPLPLYINPKDPKGIKAIQAILKTLGRRDDGKDKRA